MREDDDAHRDPNLRCHPPAWGRRQRPRPHRGGAGKDRPDSGDPSAGARDEAVQAEFERILQTAEREID
ncbi:MAG TPA: hypothetical protein G4N99_08045 [Thermoflexia bacterium]|nr:hypothetical protein [Thermoflexia bacterium]